jgi:hypothetical protein
MAITVQRAVFCQGHAKRLWEHIMVRHARNQQIDEQPAAEFSEQYLLERLTAAGVGCLEDWRALSPRARRNIFGITSGMARAIDHLAKARSETTAHQGTARPRPVIPSGIARQR